MDSSTKCPIPSATGPRGRDRKQVLRAQRWLQKLPLLPRYKEAQRFWQTQAGSCCALGLKAQFGEASRGRAVGEGGGRGRGSIMFTETVHWGKGQHGSIKNIKKLSPGSVSWAHQLWLRLPAPGPAKVWEAQLLNRSRNPLKHRTMACCRRRGVGGEGQLLPLCLLWARGELSDPKEGSQTQRVRHKPDLADP